MSFLPHTHADCVVVFLSSLLSHPLSDVLALPIFKQEDSSIPPENETKNPPFQYVLCTATSPAVKLHDETLTYLNQGEMHGLCTQEKVLALLFLDLSLSLYYFVCPLKQLKLHIKTSVSDGSYIHVALLCALPVFYHQ